jgi:hypothetical protein
MGSGAVIYVYIPGFVKTGSGIQKLLGRGEIDSMANS